MQTGLAVSVQAEESPWLKQGHRRTSSGVVAQIDETLKYGPIERDVKR